MKHYYYLYNFNTETLVTKNLKFVWFAKLIYDYYCITPPNLSNIKEMNWTLAREYSWLKYEI